MASASHLKLAKNATRCGFSARQHPNYQGYVQGGDAQPSDRVAPRPATSPLTAGERIRSWTDAPGRPRL